MMKCFGNKEMELKNILQMLCCAKKIECKQGSFKKILAFAKKQKAKSAILLIKGNINEKDSKQYALLVQELTKTKKLIWALHKNKKLSFKLLLAF